jgi:cysteine desulfurase family protein
MGLMIYLDNGATSWPKPPEVAQAVCSFLTDVGASPGRAGHRLALEAGRIVYRSRETLAALFGLEDPMRLAFSPNVTESLNLVLRGLLRPGDRIITTAMEHNAAMRPLRVLEGFGVRVEQLPCSDGGRTDPSDLEAALKSEARLVLVNHASNVTGTVQDIRNLGAVVREARRKGGSGFPLLLLDAAQSGGCIDIDMERDGVDILAFTGHKGLLGPTGTGGTLFGPAVKTEDIEPLVRGGTGSRSESEEQPAFLPDRFESGTLNSAGLAGLLAGVQWLELRGLDAVHGHETLLAGRLYSALAEMGGIRLYGPERPETGLFSFNIEGMEPSEAGFRLDDEYGILCRVGLHCAPGAHRRIGTFPGGTVRFAVGPFTTGEEVERAIAAVRALRPSGVT